MKGLRDLEVDVGDDLLEWWPVNLHLYSFILYGKGGQGQIIKPPLG